MSEQARRTYQHIVAALEHGTEQDEPARHTYQHIVAALEHGTEQHKPACTSSETKNSVNQQLTSADAESSSSDNKLTDNDDT